eukprot:9447345-Pyramimonas_sp.AAC.1
MSHVASTPAPVTSTMPHVASTPAPVTSTMSPFVDLSRAVDTSIRSAKLREDANWSLLVTHPPPGAGGRRIQRPGC